MLFIKNLDYLNVLTAFSDMFSPHKRVVVSRPQHYFLNSYQKQSELIPGNSQNVLPLKTF